MLQYISTSKNILWMALFSWVPIFVDLTKFTNSHIRGVQNSWPLYFPSKCIQKIANLWVLEFVVWTLHENHENWYPTKIKSSTVASVRLVTDRFQLWCQMTNFCKSNCPYLAQESCFLGLPRTRLNRFPSH